MTAQSSAPVSASDLRVKERAENFPVALRVLPAAYRRDLRAIYDVVRVIDDLGDAADGDRTALLTEYHRDLATAWTDRMPQEATARALQPVVARRGLTQESFDRLVQANLMDQTVTAYASYDDVLHYCSLSAAPIGRMVLEVFGQSSPANVELSDRVCMALQLLEHWQDVGEDYAMGRTYLPQDDLRKFAVGPTDLAHPPTSPALRSLVRCETDRAAELLESGAPLVGGLSGWARLAVAGYVAGGRATVDALRRADGDVMAGPPRPLRRDLLRHLFRQLARPRELGRAREHGTPRQLGRPRR